MSSAHGKLKSYEEFYEEFAWQKPDQNKGNLTFPTRAEHRPVVPRYPGGVDIVPPVLCRRLQHDPAVIPGQEVEALVLGLADLAEGRRVLPAGRRLADELVLPVQLLPASGDEVLLPGLLQTQEVAGEPRLQWEKGREIWLNTDKVQVVNP